MSGRRAVVVGGGIGGLATAIALYRRGWRVKVLERAPDFTEVGAGISLLSNALRALEAIGLRARVHDLGIVELQGGVRSSTGRWLSRIDAAEVTRRYGAMTMLHRADLLRVLLEAVPSDCLHPGTEVLSIKDEGVVRHTAGVIEADLVVGADGLRSTVRRQLWPQAAQPRYAGYTAWRMITRPLPDLLDRGGELWGAGTRFGYAGLPDGRICAYASANTPPDQHSPDGELNELRRQVGHWCEPVPTLLGAVDPSAVLRHDIYDLPDLPTFVRGRVVLLGDAAHAMTPNLGQGACQALEDAATLAAVVDDPDGLARYDQLRRPRTQSIVARSRQMGAVGQWSAKPAVLARDLLLPLVPAGMAMRSLGSIFDWAPPEPTG
jgi:2-polyprenyl-6-methoxyphenol hydroxylase-like FAD-dependent oxidoreductase